MTQCQVGVVMGSNSDWDTMQHAAQILQEFGVSFETRVVSAHRMPDDMFAYAEAAQGRGLRAIIAGAGGAAHLPGMIAAKTIVPVLGVPVASKHLQGVDSLHSIVQMPKGIPVATFAIGNAGAANAALFAVALLASTDAVLAEKLQAFRVAQTEVTALLVGPTGAGKEVLARVLHESSPRAKGAVCGAELRGHARALDRRHVVRSREGRFYRRFERAQRFV